MRSGLRPWTGALAAVGIAASAAVLGAQQARQLGGVGITVWTDAFFRGESATFRQPIPDLTTYRFARRITSLRIGRGEYWEGCELPNFRGRCQVFSGEERNLSTTAWNDKIASLRPVNASGGDVGGPRPPGGGRTQIILYSLPNYRGDYRAFNSPVVDIRAVDFNDRAQSARVTGAWQVCQDVNFVRCRPVSGDWPTLASAGLAGKISSLRPMGMAGGGPPPPPPVKPRLVLYAMPGYQGNGVPIAGPLPNVVAPAVSATVEGRWLVCDGPAFSGRCATMASNVPDLRAVGLRTVRSARPQ